MAAHGSSDVKLRTVEEVGEWLTSLGAPYNGYAESFRGE